MLLLLLLRLRMQRATRMPNLQKSRRALNLHLAGATARQLAHCSLQVL